MADIDRFIYYENGSKKVLKPNADRIVIGSGGLAFEGATDDDFEITLAVTDPTDDRTITFPDEDGDVALLQADALPKALSFPVKNPSTTTTLTKGQIVYISGHSGNKPEVSLARSDSSSTMPAFGFVQNDIAAEAEGYVVYSGLFKGIDTNANYNEGDTLYVSSTTAGGFENTPPTGSALIQNIGKIVKSHATNGEILVGGAGRTNATPNLNTGKFFIGDSNNQSSISTYTLPTTDGSANQDLTTNGSGAVSFATVDPTTYTSFTTNRVIHSNASGSLTASDFLKVDDSNNRLGIGTLTPLTTVEIVGDASGEAQLSVRQHNNDPDGPDVVFYKSRGSESSKTAVQASDALTRINTKAYNGTAYVDAGYYGWNASDTSGNSTFTLATTVSGTQAERFGIDSSGNTTITGGLKLIDDVKITLGTGEDLEIYHNGANNIIKGTGGINVQTGDFKIVKLDGSSTIARFQAAAGIELYHNANKKLETIATGIQTTGTVNINGAYTLPTSDGSASQVLTTDGSGAVSFATVDPTTYSNFTINRAIISNGSGNIAVSDITSSELGHLDGVTSNIQTQLNSKQNILTFGISDTNSLRVDSSSITSGEYARFTTAGLESRSAAEVRSDLGVDAAGTDNSTDVTLANTNYLSISGQEITGGTVPLSSGGTGATTAAGARTALGLGSISTQAANSVNITGGTIAGLSDLEVTGGDVTKIKLYHSSTNISSGPEIEFSRYDSSANGIEAGDNLGEIWFRGSEDDTNFYKAAAIIGEADGSWDPGVSHLGRLSFYTTSGSSTYNEVLKLDSSQNATFANNVSINGTLGAGIATLASNSVIGNMTYSNNTITGADSNDINIVSKDSITIKLDSDNNSVDSSLLIVDNTDTIKAYIRETGAASFLSISASSGSISGTIAAQTFAGPANTNLLASSTDDIVFLVDSNNNEGKNYLYYYTNNISTTDNKFMEIADNGELTLYGNGIVNCKQLVSNNSGNFSINIAATTSLDITEGISETVVFSLDTNSDEISYKFDLIPSTNNTYDLGSSSNKVKDAYVDGIVYTDAVSSANFSVDASGDITLDADGGEIYFKDNGVTGGTFHTNEGILKTEGRIVIKETDDVDLDGTSGGLVIGNELGSHLAFDQNEIMAKSTPTTATTLYLNNEGGQVSIGSTDPVASATALVVNGDSKTAGYYVCEMNNGASDLASYSNNILHLKYTNITTANLDSSENYVLFSGSDGFTGSIDANGGTVNYNAFTGQHISPISTSEVTEIENLGVGSIVISNGVNLLNNSINETYVGSSLSRAAKDKRVYGVVSNLPWYPGNDGWANWENDAPAVTINSLGNGRILVTNISGNIENGDYICSSVIDGFGMLQDDDLLHNYTVAKCTEHVDWDSINEFITHEGVSYKKCLVGCTYHCG